MSSNLSSKIAKSQLSEYQLSDRYSQLSGRVYMTGTQALVRIVLDQARRDKKAGLKTGGFVSGYRGSPLGSFDLELWKAKEELAQGQIEFLPAVNEDLAATAVLGSQQVETDPDKEVEGVFAMWYGKGPGVDRSGDALKHGNAYGSSPTGGVLVVAGDDHGCVSSSTPHQSDVALMSWMMPVLHPASIAEYQEFGEYGYALSRYSGMWVGFKAISETVESAASMCLHKDREFVTPDMIIPPDGLHYRWPDLPGPQIETRFESKKKAVFEFAECNPIDRKIYSIDNASFGIVTTGKAHLDVMEALRLLGVDEESCQQHGIDIYKVGMVWPLARRDALAFVKEKQEILVVEEKRGIIESQLKEYFYDFPGHKPSMMVGKRDEQGARLVPWTGELSPLLLVPIIASRLKHIFPDAGFMQRANQLLQLPEYSITVAGATRTPYFCSGCPHNSSTKVPEGSKALAGIGCHFMASWMDRETTSLIQMGGEGVNRAGSARFTGNKHIFQNLGDGTYYHSGSMAIRQAIAANINITYKILFNDAVAMTGGQPVDGPITVQAIAHEVFSEGVKRIDVVSDSPEQLKVRDFPEGVKIYHRDELNTVQKSIRDVPGVTVLIYQQTCATEKRRRRKRNLLEDPARFAVINDLVCEGCGDCSVQSNCLSIEPLETPLGRKRKINLSTCNKDFTCINGFCPSFVTVEGGRRRKRSGSDLDPYPLIEGIAAPKIPSLEQPYNLLITGVGGTGVVTVGALISMAAHLQGKGTTVLDFTGFAQKFGPVLSFIKIAKTPESIHQVRIDKRSADALIGCDIVTSSSPKASSTYRKGMQVVLSTSEMPTGDIVQNRNATLAVDERIAAIENVVGAENITTIDANELASYLLGDSVFANIILLGMAWQKGLVAVSEVALLKAIELNAVAVENNKKAFAWGRLCVAAPSKLTFKALDKNEQLQTLDDLLEHRANFLSDYQNPRYAKKYLQIVDTVRQAEAVYGAEDLTHTIAQTLFKLMACKDEYEVARLHTHPAFKEKLQQEFEGDYQLNYHLSIQLFPGKKDAQGRPKKKQYSHRIETVFCWLAKLKVLRGSPFDVFAYTAERKLERSLLRWYTTEIDQCLKKLSAENRQNYVQAFALVNDVRGYGPVKTESIIRIRKQVTDLLSH